MKKIFLIALLFVVYGCRHSNEPTPAAPTSAVAEAWGQMTLRLMYQLPANTPTYASRALGYAGLTMYETVAAGSPVHRSLVGQLSGLNTLPQPQAGQKYNWEVALNAGQALMLKRLFDNADRNRLYRVDSLEYEINKPFYDSEAREVMERSVAYGKSVAEAIFEWSKTDGGFEAYKRNFDPAYVFPKGAGFWVAPLKGQVVSPYPLQPYWGKNRTFLMTNDLPVPAMVAYSKEPSSDYYRGYLEVYQKSKTLTQTEREIAAWWADDPSETFSPPGHSYSLANITVKTAQVDLFKAAETYARVGMAVADGFVNCWKAKYTYHCERPATYVRANIDATWEQFWPEPPFPAFYSGHSVQAAAAATVLEDLYGKTIKITDNTHEGRLRDDIRNIDYKIRSYEGFWAAAEEAALSRLYGGIHTRQDNEVGLTEGRKVGQNINQLNWKK